MITNVSKPVGIFAIIAFSVLAFNISQAKPNSHLSNPDNKVLMSTVNNEASSITERAASFINKNCSQSSLPSPKISLSGSKVNADYKFNIVCAASSEGSMKAIANEAEKIFDVIAQRCDVSASNWSNAYNAEKVDAGKNIRVTFTASASCSLSEIPALLDQTSNNYEALMNLLDA